MEQREDITAKIKEQADIVQIIGENVDLKRSGASFLGLCPFHGEKTPSFSVSPAKQFFHCFGCGESGDVFDFVMKYQSVDFPGALKILAEKYNIELPRRRQSREEQYRAERKKALFAVNKKACELFCNALLSGSAGAAARKYLKERGIGQEIVERFSIGYAPAIETGGWNFLGSRFSDQELPSAIEAGLLVSKERGGTYDRFRDRIVFPLFSISGQVCGFGGRIIGEGQPKYLNSPESLVFDKGSLLLGLFQQKEHIRRQNRAILVEGNFDLISLVANGCENVVAPLGTALTRQQLRLIKRFSEDLTLLFDGDTAGGKAALRAVPLFLAEQMAGRVAVLPSGHDPDTFIQERGLAELEQLLAKAESLPEFVLSRLEEEYGLSFDGKRKIVEQLASLAGAAASPLQRSLFISHFAEKLGMELDELKQHLTQPVGPLFAADKEKRPGQSVTQAIQPLSMSQKQLLEFMILHPEDFSTLAENGIRSCLSGSIGEILFLELERLLRQNSTAEPEDLLNILTEGPERRFVADLLIKPSHIPETEENDGGSGELADQLNYLFRRRLKEDSNKLLGRIEAAQRDGDIQLLEQLLAEQVEVSRRFHGENI
jgi:DNA primase